MGAAGGDRPRRLAPGGGPLEAKNASGGRKHIDESFAGTGTVPGRAGWTAGRWTCAAKHTPQRGGLASEKARVGPRAIRGCRVEDAAKNAPRGGVLEGRREGSQGSRYSAHPWIR